LTLTNISQKACTLAGLAYGVMLEDAKNKGLPTHVKGNASAAPVTLEPGDSATATARFSPDVPKSPGGKCEPNARQLSLNPGAGTVEAPVKPSTSVCDGTLHFGAFEKR